MLLRLDLLTFHLLPLSSWFLFLHFLLYIPCPHTVPVITRCSYTVYFSLCVGPSFSCPLTSPNCISCACSSSFYSTLLVYPVYSPQLPSSRLPVHLLPISALITVFPRSSTSLLVVIAHKTLIAQLSPISIIKPSFPCILSLYPLNTH